MLEQHTTRGLLVWRKVDNFTAFTDGATSWVNGPYGVQSRPNGQRFAWKRDPIGGQGPSSGVTPPPSTPPRLAIPTEYVHPVVDPPAHDRRFWCSKLVTRRFGSAEKAKRLLGFETTTSVREGLQRVIDWRQARGVEGTPRIAN